MVDYAPPYSRTLVARGGSGAWVSAPITPDVLLPIKPPPREPIPECHDDVSFAEWQRRVAKIFDSYRLIA